MIGRMAVALSEINLELRAAPEPASGRWEVYSGMAVVQDGRWVAICRELGTVAEGGTADDALNALEAAMRDVIEIADQEGVPRGIPVPPDEIRRLLLEHEPPAVVTLRTIVL
jgi:hypothetical protein